MRTANAPSGTRTAPIGMVGLAAFCIFIIVQESFETNAILKMISVPETETAPTTSTTADTTVHLPSVFETKAAITTAAAAVPPTIAPEWPMGKFYAVHIGPSKTGTKTIQEELRDNPWGANTIAEDKDKIIYVGKLSDGRNMKQLGSNTTIRNVNGVSKSINTENKNYNTALECMGKILDEYYNSTNDNDIDVVDNRLETNESERALLKEKFIKECWEGFEYMLSYSLLDSQESYSYSPWSWEGRGVTYMDLGRRFRMFDILGYQRLVVVGSYRRYAEWVVSAYTEWIKFECFMKNGGTHRTPCRSLNGYLADILERNTKNTEFGARFYHNVHLTLPTIAKMGPSRLEPKILNYFQLPHETKNITGDTAVKVYGSIATELYCDALGKDLTPHTCNYYRALDAKPKSGVVANKGTTSNMAYQSVVARAYKVGFIGEKKENNTSSSRFQNITTWKDLSNYHSKELGLNWVHTMPLNCLNDGKLELLLNRSLELEQRVVPDFYASEMGKEEHERLFWNVWYNEKRLFCEVDVKKLFKGAKSWDEIVGERIINHTWSSER